MDALYYGQGLGGVIFDCLNTKDEQGNSLLAKVAGGVGPLSLVRVVLKWGADINAVNNRRARRLLPPSCVPLWFTDLNLAVCRPFCVRDDSLTIELIFSGAQVRRGHQPCQQQASTAADACWERGRSSWPHFFMCGGLAPQSRVYTQYR